ncbi:MAG: orotidine-5'-phosphate decarboxylase [Elusimicrobia bacterium]|nr:orotidine-5'-phosphate decarboxylase [Elusimicrobiota bacterium]
MTELIVALDVSSLSEAERILGELKGQVSFYKVGLRLFTAEGKNAVELVQKFGGKVFLDLKMMDIPQTVGDAILEAGKLGAYSVSLYLWGGIRMLEAASRVQNRPKLWGVTVLTSLGDEDLKSFDVRDIKNLVKDLAHMGEGLLDGYVCSGQELQVFQNGFKKKPTLIVPGVRPAGSPIGDQKRVVTPAEAAKQGADFIVVGRPILATAEPAKMVDSILHELKSGSVASTLDPSGVPAGTRSTAKGAGG